MVRAAVFDIDGTLVDSVDFHAEAWQRALRHFGYRDITFEAVRSQIGKGGDQLMPVFVPKGDLERIGSELEAFREEVFQREYLPRVRAFPGVRDLLARIREEGLRIVLASSSKKELLSGYKQKAGIEDLVEDETSSDDAERSKPHPDIFAAALQRVKIDPRDAVVIGDTPYDAQAASKLGIGEIVGVLCGGFAEKDLREAGCRHIFRDPSDLLARFSASPLAIRRAA